MAGKTFVYVGNWSAPSAKPGQNGLGIFSYDENTGKLTHIKNMFTGINVGSTCLDREAGILYFTNELHNYPGQSGGGGQVFAAKLDPETGDMTELGCQPAFGASPSYIAVDSSRKYIIVCSHVSDKAITKIVKDIFGKYHITTEYDDTATVLFPLAADGSVGEPCDVYKHTGRGFLPTQTNPHVHSVMISPSGNLFAECDKGTDRIYFFKIDREAGKLVLCDNYKSLPGSSPRYSCFHPTLPFWFMNNETMQVVRAFRYSEEGKIDHIGTIDVLPDGCNDDPSMGRDSRARQSDIRIHPSGKWLYALLRVIDSASVLAIDQSTGELTKIQSAALDGKGPRGCAVSPDGRFLLIAALDSGEIITWSIGEDGTISPTGLKASQPCPGNVTFYQP